MVNIYYNYSGVDKNGKDVSGRISADNETELLKELRSQGIHAYKLEPVSQTRKRSYTRQRARPQDQYRFIRQLGVLLKAGCPLLEALETVEADEPCHDLAEQIGQIRKDLRAGGKLSSAINTYIPLMPYYTRRFIELGEVTGKLSDTLEKATQQMEYDLRAVADLRNALAYPAFLAVAGFAAILFIFMFVVPRFANMIGDNLDTLPTLSRYVIEFGVFLNTNLITAMLCIIFTLILTVWLGTQKTFRDGIWAYFSKLPVVGGFLRATETAKWARICGTALAAGAQLLNALQLAENSVRTKKQQKSLQDVRRAIRAGSALDEAMRTHTDVDVMTLNLLRTGRVSGAMDEMLIFIADMAENEARDRSKRLTALAEPVAILVIASIVGVIVISLVLAMTSLYEVAI